MSKKIIIFGGSGYVGSNLDHYLKSKGYETLPISSRTIDLLDENSIDQVRALPLKNATVVIASAIPRAKSDDIVSFSKNLRIICNLTHALSLDYQVKSAIFLSAADVYGKPRSDISENETYIPKNFYGTYKLTAENILRLSLGHIPLSILRLPGIYGGVDDNSSLLSRFVKSIAVSKEIVLSNNGETRRGFLSINFLSESILAAIKKPIPGVYNVSDANELSLLKIIQILSESIKVDARIRLITEKTSRDFDLSFNCERLTQFHQGLKQPDLETNLKRFALTEFQKIHSATKAKT